MDPLPPVAPDLLATDDDGTDAMCTSCIWHSFKVIPASIINFLSDLQLPDNDAYPPKSPLPVVTDTSFRWEDIHQDQEPDSNKAEWSQNNCSRNIRIEPDPRLLYRHQTIQVTDVAISEKAFIHGMHIININWPEDKRGSHAVISVALQGVQKQSKGYVDLLGNDQKSWGWDLKKNKLLFDNKVIATYPKCSESTDFKAPANIRCVLNMAKGVLGFETRARVLCVRSC